VHGKSLYCGGEKLLVRGVTFGTFEDDYPPPLQTASDLERMAGYGVNAVRTYTVPPTWFLDLAHEHGLRVMVGIPWEQHIAFLDSRSRRRSIRDRIAAGVSACAEHPAVLCYAVGNEIPAPIVRWHGGPRVAEFITDLVETAKQEDPGGLATYVNYPSTEYLHTASLDLVCFNVFLEDPDAYAAYLGRLQRIAGDRPLLITETGLDSRRNGLAAQARAVDWQVRRAFEAGSAGIFLFSWCDEWYRGGELVDDWDFGLVSRARAPKPALEAAAAAFQDVPLSRDTSWPRISVIVCVYNGADTLRQCLVALSQLDYPDHEVIVVDDASTDGSLAIAAASGFHTIALDANQGLSHARNVGLAYSTGEIVAYLDADAWPDPHWLQYLAVAFLESEHACVGGPNIEPRCDKLVAAAVAKAPGAPIHVLVGDRAAEHVPGCNMAFRKEPLEAVGGFDPQFQVAGDDVDICWRIQERGWTIGFSPGAVVWHRRRDSVRSYLRQQFQYGKAEALLERRWPEKYSAGGHVRWTGRVYRDAQSRIWPTRRRRIHYGTWGSSLFQQALDDPPGVIDSLTLMTESYLVLAGLAALSALGLVWTPLLFFLPLLVGLAAAILIGSVLPARRAVGGNAGPARRRILIVALTALLHALHPLARLTGRIRHGLSPWRRRSTRSLALPRPRRNGVWSEHWQPSDVRLRAMQRRLRECAAVVTSGGPHDRWDLHIAGGMLGGARIRTAVEEHGRGRQLLLFRSWPTVSRSASACFVIASAVAFAASAAGAVIAATVAGCAAVVIAGTTFYECALAAGSVCLVLGRAAQEEERRMAGEDLVAELAKLAPLARLSVNRGEARRTR
jgi:GT2 family glycosyltransferase